MSRFGCLGVLVVTALLAAAGFGLRALLTRESTTHTLQHSTLELRELAKVRRLHIYRMVLSDRVVQHYDASGLPTASASGRGIDFIGVCTVDAYVPLESVRFVHHGDPRMAEVYIPEIRVQEGNLDESASFTWRNDATDLLNAVTLAADTASKRAVALAVERGILDEARASARTFFESFFRAMGYSEVRVFFAVPPSGSGS